MVLRLEGGLLLQLRYLWRQKIHAATVLDNHTLRFWRPLGPSSTDGLWLQESAQLAAGQSQLVELDLLPREIFGRLIYLGFCRIKLLWIHNRSQEGGMLRIGPGPEDGWEGPWNSQAALLLPPQSVAVIASPGQGWAVSPSALTIELTALQAPVVYDLAVVGRLLEFEDSPGQTPPESPEASSSSDCSSEPADSSADEGSSETTSDSQDPSSEDSSFGDSSSWEDSSGEESFWW